MSDVINVGTPAEHLLQLTLNRPQQLNALSSEVLERLLQLLKEARADQSIKGVLLTGEGKGFCAGADINQLRQLSGPQGYAFARKGQAVFRCLETLNKPTVAAIHGFALGGGCELAMSATLRVVANNAVFGQPEIKLGIIPGFGGTQRLSRLIGKGRAMHLCLSGKRFSAEEALAWGFANEMTAPEELLPKAIKLLQALVMQSSVAMQSIMTVIDDGYNLTLEDALQLEALHFGICCTTKDKQEGVSAFLEKRPAVFSGE